MEEQEIDKIGQAALSILLNIQCLIERMRYLSSEIFELFTISYR